MEVCVDTVASVINAVKGGSKRLELCSSLGEGGLTPSIGFLKITREIIPGDCKIFVMIRPRASNFNYTDDELRIMIVDIRLFKEKGADGFVFGCLNGNNEINICHCQKLLNEAHPLPCTFHRAFDLVRDPTLSLKQLESMGFSRILTSGLKETAFSGMDTIKTLIDLCKSYNFRIKIMPGGGINERNLEIILEHTGAKEFHGSAKSSVLPSEMCLTSEHTVREMIKIGHKFGCNYESLWSWSHPNWAYPNVLCGSQAPIRRTTSFLFQKFGSGRVHVARKAFGRKLV